MNILKASCSNNNENYNQEIRVLAQLYIYRNSKKKILKAICYLTTITTYQPNILFKSYTYNFKLNIINVNHAGFYIYPFKFKQNLTILTILMYQTTAKNFTSRYISYIIFIFTTETTTSSKAFSIRNELIMMLIR